MLKRMAQNSRNGEYEKFGPHSGVTLVNIDAECFKGGQDDDGGPLIPDDSVE